MNLTYEIVENGYIILNDGVAWIEQVGFTPYPAETLEESAEKHIKALLANPEAVENQKNELDALKEQLAMQEQAITELSIYIATLGI